MPLFSVVIPSYNRAPFIAATIDSVLAQEEGDYEIIVADDGSTDDTLAVLAGYGDRIKVYRQANAGPGAARNLALEHATGTYVAFLDSDDLWPPWTLATFKAAIDAADAPSIVSARWTAFTGHPPALSATPPPLSLTRHDSFFRSPLGWHLPSATTMRRDMLATVGGFTTAPCEDVDIWLRIGAFPGFVTLSSPPLCLYRTHAEGISNTSRYRFDGIRHLLRTERAGGYGGVVNRGPRRRYIAQAARVASLFYVDRKRPAMAWSLYWQSLALQVRERRARYLLAFPFMAACRGLPSWKAR
ncbi:MAG: glycosyltransferase family 2 protein [Planctomycetes bacterium]|nr:glycosyltransferase family 2 protein [Planctomycetota bacterium]